jgi:serine/threonine protein kinase
MIAGRSTAWKLIKKLGEGDAGEVYLVESLLEGREAILKRPYRSSFPSEVTRQAAQIETEGKILRAMENLSLEARPGKVKAPALLDLSKAGTEFSERYFIVIEKAAGFDLNSLARAVTMGEPETESPPGLTPQDTLFHQLVSRGVAPRLLLLRVLSLTLNFIREVHGRMLNDEGMLHNGAIWNDIKPDHLFWDPFAARLTLIDWGNGKFLQADGTTKDRQSSVNDDSRQFIQEMGRFLGNFQPDLLADLEWPEGAAGSDSLTSLLESLLQRIDTLCIKELDDLAELKKKERELFQSASPSLDMLAALNNLQERILQYGDQPDYQGTEALALGLSTSLASQGSLDSFEEVCLQATQLPVSAAEKWRLLAEISHYGREMPVDQQKAFQQALVAGLVDDWPAVVWELAQSCRQHGQPQWWNELSERMRRLHFSVDPELLPPYTALHRVLYVLQSNATKLENQPLPDGGGQADQADMRKTYRQLIDAMRSEILPNWEAVDPEPPDSGLEYLDVTRILDDLGTLIPNAQLAMNRTLDQPSAQVRILLEAWGRKEFDISRKGLRQLLLWDPHRWRVLSAEQAIRQAPVWLETVRRGPQNGESLADCMARLELEGRELRSRVGPARWLDLIITTLQRMRKGARANDLLAGNTELALDMPWISRVGWVPANPAVPRKQIQLERVSLPESENGTIEDLQETRIGQPEGFLLGDPLDTWAPEARGSSARVFQGFLRNNNGHLKQAAIKIMRSDRIEYALPLFQEEVKILQTMQGVPGITGILELGYIKLDRGLQLPPETTSISGRELRGEVQRYPLAHLDEYHESLPGRISKGWLPYLALEKRNSEENLMLLCDAGYTRGRFLSLAEGLRVSIQICEVLQVAHQRNIVYRDHKILHYYWQELYNGVFLIDWNVAKLHPQGLSAEEKQFDLVQFGARALHHIFTGRSAPGALPMGPTRPEEIDAAAHSYKVQWTYDDQRLPFEMKDLMEQVLSGAYTEVADLQQDLMNAFIQIQGLPASAAAELTPIEKIEKGNGS